jgi:hypothetical protein
MKTRFRVLKSDSKLKTEYKVQMRWCFLWIKNYWFFDTYHSKEKAIRAIDVYITLHITNTTTKWDTVYGKHIEQSWFDRRKK